MLLVFFFYGLAHAGEKDNDRLALIDLMENRLAAAYTFRPPVSVPDFTALDTLMPLWDKGSPGKARRQWVETGNLSCRCTYRVDSVYISSEYTAEIKGRKKLACTRFDEGILFDGTKSYSEDVLFSADVYRDLEGNWLLRKIFEY